MPLVSNGTTLDFASAEVGELESVEYSDDGNPVDLTNLGDSQHVFGIGLNNIEITFTIKGQTSTNAPSVGSTGSITINWNDGNSDTISSALVTSRTTSGEIDGPITTSFTVVPAN